MKTKPTTTTATPTIVKNKAQNKTENNHINVDKIIQYIDEFDIDGNTQKRPPRTVPAMCIVGCGMRPTLNGTTHPPSHTYTATDKRDHSGRRQESSRG
jgi:hypothetical protein